MCIKEGPRAGLVAGPCPTGHEDETQPKGRRRRGGWWGKERIKEKGTWEAKPGGQGGGTTQTNQNVNCFKKTSKVSNVAKRSWQIILMAKDAQDKKGLR